VFCFARGAISLVTPSPGAGVTRSAEGIFLRHPVTVLFPLCPLSSLFHIVCESCFIVFPFRDVCAGENFFFFFFAFSSAASCRFATVPGTPSSPPPFLLLIHMRDRCSTFYSSFGSLHHLPPPAPFSMTPRRPTFSSTPQFLCLAASFGERENPSRPSSSGNSLGPPR